MPYMGGLITTILTVVPIGLLIWFLFFSGVGIGGALSGGVSTGLIIFAVVIVAIWFIGGKRK